MTDESGRAWWRQTFNREWRKPALDRAEVENATRAMAPTRRATTTPRHCWRAA
jgi:hypothetical protein